MRDSSLKLKQASVVLGVAPKELQNLVQFRVVRPRRGGSEYRFDAEALLQAKVAWLLKRSLGVPTNYLATLVATFAKARAEKGDMNDIRILSRPQGSFIEIEVKIPVRQLMKELNERMPLADVNRDLPRGRKRPGWKKEFLSAVQEASAGLSTVSEGEIRRVVAQHRSARGGRPEITVA